MSKNKPLINKIQKLRVWPRKLKLCGINSMMQISPNFLSKIKMIIKALYQLFQPITKSKFLNYKNRKWTARSQIWNVKIMHYKIWFQQFKSIVLQI